jgi:tetratricopeptide (TPR) repeat protein
MANRSCPRRRFLFAQFGFVCLIVAVAAAARAQPETPRPSTTRESRFSRSAEMEIRFQEGLLLYQRGQLPQAESDFKQVIAGDAGDADAWYYLGLSQLDQNRPADAVASFDQSIRLDPTSDEVRAARATANIRLKNYDAVKEDLAVLEPDPKWRTLVPYLRGQMYYQQGDLDAAAREFAAAKAAGGTEAVPAGFYEGLTYIRMRELVRARRTFQDASLSADRDPTVVSAARQLDAVLAAQQQTTKRWEVQLTLGYEYDTNVIQIGTNVPTPGEISDEEDGRFVLQPRGSYSFIRNDRLEVGLEGSGYFTWQNDLSDFDVASYQAGPFVNYKLRENLYASARYSFNYVELGHDPFLKRNVITPQLTLVEPKFGYTSLYYQFQTRQFDEVPISAAEDRDGPVHSVGLVQGFTLPEIFRGAGESTLELSYRFERQETDGSDYQGNFHSLGATFYAPLPVWKLRADAGVTFDFENYDNPNTLDSDRDRRRDFEFDITAGLTRQINKYMAARVDYSYTRRDSNIVSAGQDIFDYDRHILGVRLIFSF